MTPDDTPESPPHPDALLAHLDAARGAAALLVVDRARWEAEASRQRAAAEALAEGTRDLVARVRQAEADAQRRAAERQELAERLRRAEAAAEQARAAAEAQSRQASADQARSRQLLDEALRLHALRPTGLGDQDTVFGHILAASVALAAAERGACLGPADPFDILATERLDDEHRDSPLLRAVAHRVSEQHEPLVLNEPAEILALANDPLAASLRNLVGYPIVVGEGIAGVVVVADRQDGPFSEEETRLLLGIGGHAGIALENHRLRHDLEAAHAGTLALLGDVIEAKDPYTQGHCEEVAVLALATARELGLGPEEQRIVFQTGLLHDVGKVAVSDGILLKPGALLPAEREVIETHVIAGADLVAGVPALGDLVPIIRHHHERYDGTGYPDKLAGDAIPRLARVIAVADAYEAMRTDRPYRTALGPEATRDELRQGAGTQFDPEVVEAMLRALETPDALRRARHDALGDAPPPGPS